MDGLANGWNNARNLYVQAYRRDVQCPAEFGVVLKTESRCNVARLKLSSDPTERELVSRSYRHNPQPPHRNVVAVGVSRLRQTSPQREPMDRDRGLISFGAGSLMAERRRA